MDSSYKWLMRACMDKATDSRRQVARAVLGVLVIMSSSCQTFLPAHSLSEDTRGERLSVRPLTKAEVLNEYGGLLTAADKKSLEGEPLRSGDSPGIAAGPIAGLALSFLKDYLVQAVESEASRYSSEYSLSGAFEFWEDDTSAAGYGLQQRCWGIELSRTSEGEGGWTLLLLLLPAQQDSMLAVKPAFFELRSAKAKVLSYEAKDWWSTPWTWLLNTGDCLDMSFSITVESARRNGPGSSRLDLGEMLLQVAGMPLGSERTKFSAPIGWIPAPGQSTSVLDPTVHVGYGPCTIKLQVVEADTSRASELLASAVERIKETSIGEEESR